MKKCIIILGMHRSGTSAVSGFFYKLGMPFGSKLLEPNEYNEKGYFENIDIVNANDRILRILGSSWDDQSGLGVMWWKRPELQLHSDEIRKILLDNFSGCELFCVKDPRITILLPFWIDILKEMNISAHFVIPVRHPLEVARSLGYRNGFSTEKGLVLWMNYMLSGEQYSRSFKRRFFLFDDFLKHPGEILCATLDYFQIALPAGARNPSDVADELIDAALKHHRCDKMDSDDECLPIIMRYYTTLSKLGSGDESGDQHQAAEMDKIRNDYENLIRTFCNKDVKKLCTASGTDAVVADWQSHLTQEALSFYEERISSLKQIVMEKKYELTTHRQMMQKSNHELTSVKKAVEKQNKQIAGLQKALDEKEEKINCLNHTVNGLQENVLWRDAIISDREKTIHSLYQSTSWRLTRPVRVLKDLLNKFKPMELRRRAAGLLGMMHWPDGLPKISQGFAGEELPAPGENFNHPLISVVMPVYNACRSDEKHFLHALESIANQSYENIELIIVDDGSTDNSEKVCGNFLSRRTDLSARYFRKINGGQSSARNFGVKHCQGEYIAFIDQDDEWYENKLEQVVPWLGDKRIDVLYTDADTIDDQGKLICGSIHQTLFAGWPHPKKSIEDILYKDVFVMPGLMTIKKTAFEKVGGFDENLSGYEDDDLFLRLFEKSKIFYLPVSTLRWRMYAHNYSFSYRMLTSRSYYWRKLLKYYTDNGEDRIRKHMISRRFFWEFIIQALIQYNAGNDLYRKSVRGAREILPYLPRSQRFITGVIFLLPLKYTMRTLVWAQKTYNGMR